jgi:hypothetical protein
MMDSKTPLNSSSIPLRVALLWGFAFIGRRFLNALLLAAFLGIGLVGVAQANVATADHLLLPDLRTLPPSDLKISVYSSGRRLLRLANTIWNAGHGPLKLSGETSPDLRRTLVTQHVAAADGSELEHQIGEFVYHPSHNHWHFAGFTLYELWSLDADAAPEQVMSTSDKLSYCVIDTDKVDPNISGFVPYKRYYSCGQKHQGLSVGWGDTYESHLDGQSLDLKGVPDGFYMLRSTANPDRTLLESNFANNTAEVYLEIRGDHLELTSPHEIFDAHCVTNGWC